jgi:hypothetical protein
MFRWQLTASCDKDVIMRWIGSGNKAKPINLAIRTGVRNSINGKYLVGTDLDLIDHPMKMRLERTSRTVTQRSGSGGDHAFYWSDFPVKNSVQLIEEKMDIRGSGGIVVIAPSMHKSGNRYKFTCDLRDTEIQDLPEFLVKKMRITVSEKNRQQKEQKTPTASAHNPSAMTKLWSLKSIPDLRSCLISGEKIPLGVRNATMHRLLSSDRAKGVPTTTKLMAKAMSYLDNFESPESFKEELPDIVKSVMRYPAYNNSHEKVNELYFKWLSKRGYKSTSDLETLEALDKEFFNMIEPCSEIDGMVSLSEVSVRRADFLKAKGLAKFATYRSQLLSKKLIALGASKKRTSKGNFWAIRFKPNTVKTTSDVCNNEPKGSSKEYMNMANTLNDMKDGDVITRQGKQFRVELVKTKVKHNTHPREHLYFGKTGYDYNKALLEVLVKIPEDKVEEFMDGNFVTDLEKTSEVISHMEVGDIVGIKEHRYQILDLSDSIVANKVKPSKVPGVYVPCEEDSTETITIGQVDFARALGLVDILWRNGKPFGVDEEQDMTVVLLHDLDESSGKKKK